jgi:hypothetical protein
MTIVIEFKLNRVSGSLGSEERMWGYESACGNADFKLF